ncbi:hypothetical protein [Sphaerisporangium aureirubrum]|uniref:Uncharacterized protein n=1 Tax=Sphaerisporangium aureirubrum TaxID=1544736 RepID=A0ABW1NF19_9ACTN
MPPLWWRPAKQFRAARAGRRDGRLGVPYDHFATENHGLDSRRWTTYIQALAAESTCRRARVLKAFIRDSKPEQGALLLAAGKVNDLARRLEIIGSRCGAAGKGGRTFPLSAEDVISARHEKSSGGERRALEDAFSEARQAMTGKIALYEAAISRMRTEMHEVAGWSNRMVAHYRESLDRAYLIRKRRKGRTDIRLPVWVPAEIKPETSEEQMVLSGDHLSLLSPKIRGVVEEALRHLAAVPAGERGAA